MARYYNSYGKRKKNSRIIYIMLIILAALVAGFFYFKDSEQEQSEPNQPDLNAENINSQTDSTTQDSKSVYNSADNTNYSQDNVDKVLQKQKQLLKNMQGQNSNQSQVEEVPAIPPAPEIDLQTPPEPTADSNPEAAEMINEALEYLNASPKKVIEARDLLNKTLQMPISSEQREFVKSHMSRLAADWLFSRKIYPGDPLTDTYKVQPGDLLSSIGDKFNTPHQIIMQINHISSPRALQAGQTLKVVNGPFHARVNRSDFRLDLYLQNTFINSYPVGLARKEFETPTGLWVVKTDGKLIRPTWTDPDTGKTYLAEDPNYPLGARWIAIRGLEGNALGRTGFALHGTKDEDSIGQRSSRGCIRMHNDDIVLMYNLLMPGVSRIEIVD